MNINFANNLTFSGIKVYMHLNPCELADILSPPENPVIKNFDDIKSGATSFPEFIYDYRHNPIDKERIDKFYVSLGNKIFKILKLNHDEITTIEGLKRACEIETPITYIEDKIPDNTHFKGKVYF